MKVTGMPGPGGTHAPVTATKTFNTQRSPSAIDAKREAASKEAATPTIPQQTSTVEAKNPQTTIVEAPKTAPTEAPTQQLSPQFAELARKEQQIRKAQQELAREKEAWKATSTQQISKQQLQENTLQVLSEAGITYDKLVELQLGQAAAHDPQVMALKEIASLKAELAETKKRYADDREQDFLEGEKQALNVIRSDVKLLVESDPAYETIKATDSVGHVVELIEKVFKEDGDMLSVEEASKLVEEQLIEHESTRIKKLRELSKIKAKLEPLVEEAPQAAQPNTQSKPSAKTLTNAHGVQRPLSARERAIQAFNATKLRK